MSTGPEHPATDLILQALTEDVEDGVFILDRQGRFTYVNEFIARSSGFPPKAFLGRNFLELIRPEDRIMVRQKFEEARGGRGVLPFELAYLTASGREMWVEAICAPLHRGGDVVGVLGITRNMQKRKFMEKALLESEEKYRLLVESLPHAVCIIQDDVVAFANRALIQMLRLPAGQELGELTLLDFVDPGSRKEMADRLRRRMAGEGGLPSGYPVQLCRFDGESFPAEVYVQTMQYRGRLAAQCVAVDLTERIRLEEQLRYTQKMEAVGTLAGGIAHDFNNLLTSILGLASLLGCRRGLPSEARQKLALIEIAAEQAAGLTRQLLDFASRKKTAFQPTDVHSIISDVSNLLRHSVDKNITLEYRPKADHAVVRGDSSQIQQAVMNLAVNASDAMPTGGRLTIETVNIEVDEKGRDPELDLPAGSYLVVSVSDTGQGISESIRRSVFEPFFSTKPAGQGTGMGLAVVYGVSRKHGGTVRCQSRESRGTRFELFLPLAPPGLSAAIRGGEVDFSGGGKILLVDDQQILRETVTSMLNTLGYEVVLASNARQALDLYRENRRAIDLVLLDVGMPEMNGITCFHELKKIDSRVEIILSSGYPVDPAIQELIDEQEISFLEKPYPVSALSSAVKQQLQKNKHGRR